MSNEEKERAAWTFEHAVYIKRRYVASFFVQDDPRKINSIKSRINAIQQVLGESKTRTMTEILLAGLDKMEKEIESGGRGKRPERGTPEYRAWAIAQKRREIYEREAMLAELEPIYKDLGPEAFVKWCESQEIGYGEFLERYSWRSAETTQSCRDRDWLRTYLESQDGEASTGDIRRAAIDAGIVVDDRDWHRLEKNAERAGIVKGYGTWGLDNGSDI